MSEWQPHVVVAAIVERDGRFLMVEEFIAGELRLNQPAGHWEQGETLFEATRRETLEESGWDVEPRAFLGVYAWHPASLPYPFVRLAFVAEAVRHHADRALDSGILRAAWLTPDEVKARESQWRSPSVWQCILDYRAGRFMPLDRVRESSEIERIPQSGRGA